MDDVQVALSIYNFENFENLINSSFDGPDKEVDIIKLEDLKKRIDNYFDEYAQGDESFKEFIKIISIYLTFIEKKPLHPPGIIFSGGDTVYKKGNEYFCTGKKYFINEKQSLCKYCVCRNI
jgi:uncharacterized protein (UPF0305 family)